jgi:hypothetical protein
MESVVNDPSFFGIITTTSTADIEAILPRGKPDCVVKASGNGLQTRASRPNQISTSGAGL